MTVVLDLERGCILHVQEGKDAAALVGFLKKLKRRKAKPLAVAMDMSPAYFSQHWRLAMPSAIICW